MSKRLPDRRLFLQASGTALLGLTTGVLSVVGTACSEELSGKIRLGVVGGNFGSRFFFNQHPQCVVTGVTDLRPERRQHLMSVYQCDTAYDSFEDMVAKAKNIDAVAIFSDAPSHVKHAKMALDRGWHVLSACPACASLEEAFELKEAVEKSGLSYMQAETSWYRPEAILARNLYREGKLGEVFYTEAEYYHDRGSLSDLVSNKKTRFWNPDGTRSWRVGYPPLGYPTHALGFIVGVTGERITRVSALGWGSKHEFLEHNRYDNPFWNEASLMETNQGHMVRVNVFWLVPEGGERAQWHGDKGGLWMANESLRTPTMQGPRVGQAKRIDVRNYWKSDMLPEALRHRSHHGDSAVFITAEFINALVQKRRPEIDLYHSLAMTVPGLVGHQSALKRGEQLPVPQFDPT